MEYLNFLICTCYEKENTLNNTTIFNLVSDTLHKVLNLEKKEFSQEIKFS